MSAWTEPLSRALRARGLHLQPAAPVQPPVGPSAVAAAAESTPALRWAATSEDNVTQAVFALHPAATGLRITELSARSEAATECVLRCIQAAAAAAELLDVMATPLPGNHRIDWAALGFRAAGPDPAVVVWRTGPASLTLDFSIDSTLPSGDHPPAPATAGPKRPPHPPGAPHIPGGRYLATALVGRGAMGEVWSVLDTRLNRQAALKIQRVDHIGRPSRRLRFLFESAITAQLDHPATTTVLDRGELDDGRVWFIMDLVRGDTLDQWAASRRVPPSHDRWPSFLQDTLEIVRTIAQALSSAHASGIVHRDVKPANIMVGTFGETKLMDWGVARQLSGRDIIAAMPSSSASSGSPLATRAGQRVGTPAFMAPEQARGETDTVGPAADLHALGMTLLVTLTGHRPRRVDHEVDPAHVARLLGPLGFPAPIRRLLMATVAPAPADRPSAEALAEQLGAWLAGALERDASRQQTQAALEQLDHSRALFMAWHSRLSEGEQALDAAPRGGDRTERVRAWRLFEQAEDILHSAISADITAEEHLREALALWPDNHQARSSLGELLYSRLLRAESAGAAETVQETLIELRALDSHALTRRLEGTGAINLHTSPPGAEVVAVPQVERDGRLTDGEPQPLGTTPIEAHPLPPGSWVLHLTHPDCDPVRYPVHVERDSHWRGIAPGETAPRQVVLPPRGTLSKGERYVPAGWYQAGGDSEAVDSWRRRWVWVDGFVIRSNPITCADLIRLLTWADTQGLDLTHLIPEGASGAQRIVREDGRWCVKPLPGFFVGEPHLHQPLTKISAAAFAELARYEAQRTGLPWRLPTAEEWEKAARGVDARTYPWGDLWDPGLTASIEVEGIPDLLRVDSPTEDASPYGIFWMAGLVSEFTCSAPRWHLGAHATAPDPRKPLPELVELRGCSIARPAAYARVAARSTVPSHAPGTWTGARLVATWPPREQP